jgi:hypothetical protein
MKKTAKELKLKLHRETLRALEQQQLLYVNGGLTNTTCRACSCNTCGTQLC